MDRESLALHDFKRWFPNRYKTRKKVKNHSDLGRCERRRRIEDLEAQIQFNKEWNWHGEI